MVVKIWKNLGKQLLDSFCEEEVFDGIKIDEISFY
jgi:hypothetical protein